MTTQILHLGFNEIGCEGIELVRYDICLVDRNGKFVLSQTDVRFLPFSFIFVSEGHQVVFVWL